MADVMTPEQRSRCMSRIKGSNTKPEIVLRHALWAAGTRYRLKTRLLGRPDITFVSARVVVFVDGCFWHACPLHRTTPKTNASFWRTKIRSNVARDAVVNATLKREGWTVVRIWEHEITGNFQPVVTRILRTLQRATRGA